jgi:ribosomal protein S8E
MLQTQQLELEGFPNKDFENPEEGTTQKWKNKTAETKKSTSSMKKVTRGVITKVACIMVSNPKERVASSLCG